MGGANYLSNSSSGVGTAPFDGGGLTPVPDAIRWTLVIPQAWDQSRRPRKKALRNGAAVQFRSSHGSYIYIAVKAGESDWVAMHRQGPWDKSFQLIKEMGAFLGSAEALTYGSSVCAHWQLDEDYYLGVGRANRVLGKWNSNDPPTRWTLVDPTGSLPANSRLTAGSKVCLRAGSLGLSADTGIASLRMSPNCAAWEWWTIEPR